jgi:hypothetical protein
VENDKSLFVRLTRDGGAYEPIRSGAKGVNSAGNDVNLNGLVDDVIIANHYASDEEINNWYTSRTSRANATNVVAHYSFEGASPTNSVDNALGTGTSWFDTATLGNGATSGVELGNVLSFPNAAYRRIRARIGLLRLNKDSTNSEVSDDAEWSDIAGYLDDSLSYPNTAIVGTSIVANDQVSGSQPDLTYLVKGKLVPVWDGQNSEAPSISYQYNANPAWIALDLITNTRYGLGEQYDFTDVDLDRFLALANYCDEVVYDGSTSIGPDFSSVDGWTDVWFDEDAQDSDGTVRGAVYFVGYPSTPSDNHQVGAFMRVFNTAGTNINVGDGEGYEIAQVGYNLDSGSGGPGSSTFMVKAWWDKLPEEPWSGADGTYLGATQGYSTTGERRFEFNGVFDDERTAWDALIDVLSVARSAPITNGNKLSVVSARPLPAGSQPDFFIGRGSIIDGTFQIEYTGPEQKPNAIDVEFLDRKENYEKNVWRVNSPDLTNAQQATIRDYRVDSADLFGVTSRAQAERAGNYLLNSNRLLKRSGSFEMTAEGLPLEPGDVFILSHDILPRGVSGRLQEYTGGGGKKTNLVLDEPFVIESGVTTHVYIRDHRTDLVEKVVVTTPAGEYSAGQAIVLGNRVGSSPAEDGVTAVPEPGVTGYTIVKDGDELLATVSSAKYSEDMTVEVSWVEYDAAVFSDDATEEVQDALGGDELNSPLGEGYGMGSNRPSGSVLLDGPESIVATPILLTEGGVRRQGLEVGWRFSPDERARAGRSSVYIRVVSGATDAEDRSEGAWTLLGMAPSGQTFLRVPMTVGISPGDAYEVAVQTENPRGLTRRPIRCPRVTLSYANAASVTRGITSLSADQEGVLAQYSWNYPYGESPLVEIRRGGWTLGTPVALISGKETGYIDNVSTSLTSDPFRLYAGVKDTVGGYSSLVDLDYNPTIPTESEEFAGDFAEQAWETYVDGWFTDDVLQPAEDPVLTDLVVAAGGYMEFTGTSLTATYETWNPQLGSPAKLTAAVIQRVFVEAAVEAESVSPDTWEALTFAYNHHSSVPLSWEGGGTSLSLEWSITRDGLNWSSFTEFKPGIHEIALARFRLSFTRDSDSHNIKVHRFHTRIRYVEPSVTERSQRTEYLRTEMF